LQTLMGHTSIATTERYLRRLERGQAMERVRTLSWLETEVEA
jgi:integrase